MTIINYLKNFFLSVYYFRRNRKIKRINSKLKTAVEDQTKERKTFLDQEFMVFLRMYLKKDSSGKYIPLTGKNKAEIYETIMHKYGGKLKELNIHFSKNLQVRL